MIKIIRAKLHGLRVTGCDLDYHGSITLDPHFCARAGMYPLEFVEIWNKNSGARITTYIIFGDAGSRCCILNGAAARTCQPGDELIICATEYVASPEDIHRIRPRILTFHPDNSVRDTLRYVVEQDAEGGFSFAVEHLEG